MFQGPVVRCTLRAADGTEIVAHVGPEQPLPPLEPGLAPAGSSWDTDAARLLPPADGPDRGLGGRGAGSAPHRRAGDAPALTRSPYHRLRQEPTDEPTRVRPARRTSCTRSCARRSPAEASSDAPRSARAGWCWGTACSPPVAAARRAPKAAGRLGGGHGGDGGKTLRISNWPLYIDKQTVPDFEKATGHQGRVHRGHQRQQRVLRQDRRAAQAEPEHRPRHRRAHRLDGGPDDQPRLRRPARRRQVPQQGEPGRQREGRELRSGPEVQRAVAVRHDGRRATTRRRPARSSPASTTSSTPSTRAR